MNLAIFPSIDEEKFALETNSSLVKVPHSTLTDLTQICFIMSFSELFCPLFSGLQKMKWVKGQADYLFSLRGFKNQLPMYKGMYVRGCQIGMQGPQLCAEPRHFCTLDVATSRMAFFDLNLHVLQVATSNSKNWGRSVVQNCTSDTP